MDYRVNELNRLVEELENYDCPKNKKAYDNDCYDCYYYDECLGRIERLDEC